MARGILGRKVGMTQIYDDGGNVVPVTVIEAGPCHVLQLRTSERDGYEAVQLGFLDKPRRLASRSERGHVAKLSSKRSRNRSSAGVEALPKADCEPKRFVRELRGPIEGYQLGQTVSVADLFETNEETAARAEAEAAALKGKKPKPDVNDKVKSVDVTGLSKGRGFAGVMKRHNFSGQRASHGVKKVHRHAGGTGRSATPSRVPKGKRMAGQYGHTRVTVRNLQVVKMDADENLLLVRGAVPGPNGSYLVILETNKVG